MPDKDADALRRDETAARQSVNDALQKILDVQGQGPAEMLAATLDVILRQQQLVRVLEHNRDQWQELTTEAALLMQQMAAIIGPRVQSASTNTADATPLA